MRILLVLYVLAFSPIRSEDWTVNGKDYHNVTVGQVEADRVHITYDGGIGTVMLADLPPELQKKFNYDAVAAKAATQAEAQHEAESDQMVQTATKQNADKEDRMNKPPFRLIGVVEQSFDDGCLVRVTQDAEARQMIASQDYGSWRAVGGGGSSPYDAANGVRPSKQTGVSSGAQHHSIDSLTGRAPAVATTPTSQKLTIVPDGLYFLSNSHYAEGQKLDLHVYQDMAIVGNDGKTYQRLVEQ